MSELLARLKRAESGAAAVEFALVALMALTIFLGIIEFGRCLYMRNEISYALDLAARKILTAPTVADDDVEEMIRNTVAFSSAAMEVKFGTASSDGVSFRTIEVRFPVVLLIPNLANGSFTLSVNRRVPAS